MIELFRDGYSIGKAAMAGVGIALIFPVIYLLVRPGKGMVWAITGGILLFLVLFSTFGDYLGSPLQILGTIVILSMFFSPIGFLVWQALKKRRK